MMFTRSTYAITRIGISDRAFKGRKSTHIVTAEEDGNVVLGRLPRQVADKELEGRADKLAERLI